LTSISNQLEMKKTIFYDKLLNMSILVTSGKRIITKSVRGMLNWLKKSWMNLKKWIQRTADHIVIDKRI